MLERAKLIGKNGNATHTPCEGRGTMSMLGVQHVATPKTTLAILLSANTLRVFISPHAYLGQGNWWRPLQLST